MGGYFSSRSHLDKDGLSDPIPWITASSENNPATSEHETHDMPFQNTSLNRTAGHKTTNPSIQPVLAPNSPRQSKPSDAPESSCNGDRHESIGKRRIKGSASKQRTPYDYMMDVAEETLRLVDKNKGGINDAAAESSSQGRPRGGRQQIRWWPAWHVEYSANRRKRRSSRNANAECNRVSS